MENGESPEDFVEKAKEEKKYVDNQIKKIHEDQRILWERNRGFILEKYPKIYRPFVTRKTETGESKVFLRKSFLSKRKAENEINAFSAKHSGEIFGKGVEEVVSSSDLKTLKKLLLNMED